MSEAKTEDRATLKAKLAAADEERTTLATKLAAVEQGGEFVDVWNFQRRVLSISWWDKKTMAQPELFFLMPGPNKVPMAFIDANAGKKSFQDWLRLKYISFEPDQHFTAELESARARYEQLEAARAQEDEPRVAHDE